MPSAPSSALPRCVPLLCAPAVSPQPRTLEPRWSRRHRKLYWRTSKRDQANEHLTTATTMYRDMDMSFWLETAEAEMRA